MVWPTLGSRKAKEQNRTIVTDIQSSDNVKQTKYTVAIIISLVTESLLRHKIVHHIVCTSLSVESSTVNSVL